MTETDPADTGKAVPGAVEFRFDFASPYSCPAALTIAGRADEAGRHVARRPVTLGPIFADLGRNDSPFNLQPAKRAFMWRVWLVARG